MANKMEWVGAVALVLVVGCSGAQEGAGTGDSPTDDSSMGELDGGADVASPMTKDASSQDNTASDAGKKAVSPDAALDPYQAPAYLACKAALCGRHGACGGFTKQCGLDVDCGGCIGSQRCGDQEANVCGQTCLESNEEDSCNTNSQSTNWTVSQDCENVPYRETSPQKFELRPGGFAGCRKLDIPNSPRANGGTRSIWCCP